MKKKKNAESSTSGLSRKKSDEWVGIDLEGKFGCLHTNITMRYELSCSVRILDKYYIGNTLKHLPIIQINHISLNYHNLYRLQNNILETRRDLFAFLFRCTALTMQSQQRAQIEFWLLQQFDFSDVNVLQRQN